MSNAYKINKLKKQRNELLRTLYRKKRDKVNLERWRKNPAIWLEERFGEDKNALFWDAFGGYENHEWDGTKNPLLEAWNIISSGDYENWCGIQSGTGTGKTYILARIVFWFLDCYLHDAICVTSAPKEDQLKLLLWKEIGKAFPKFKRIRPFADLSTLRLKVDKRFEGMNEAIGFVAGVKASEESTTKAQGFHARNMLIIMEEAAGMPLPTMTAFAGTSNGENNMIIAAGNPDSEHDPLNQFIETYDRVRKVRVSGYDHPNVVNDREIIGGAVTNSSIRLKMNAEGGNVDGFLVKSRIRGLVPDQSENSLIRKRWVLDAAVDTNNVEMSALSRDWSSNALGVDVANSKDGDMAAIARGEGNVLCELNEFQCPNASHLAFNLVLPEDELEQGLLFEGAKSFPDINIYDVPKIFNHDIYEGNIGVDAVGVGVATIQAFKLMDYDVVHLHGGANKDAIPKDEQDNLMYEFSSLRAQMYWQLREDLQHGRIHIYIQNPQLRNRLFRELTAIRYEVTNRAIVVESKEKIKKRLGKSPNLADAVVYWNWVRIDRTNSIEYAAVPIR